MLLEKERVFNEFISKINTRHLLRDNTIRVFVSFTWFLGSWQWNKKSYIKNDVYHFTAPYWRP